MDMPVESRSPLLSVMRRPGAARLWGAGVAVSVMRWLEMLAFSLFALSETGSALVVSLIVFARMLPLLFLGGIVSSLVERRDRRTTLLVALGTMLVSAVALFGAALADRLSVPLVMLAAVLGGIFWAVETPLRRTMLAEAGGMERIGQSMGLEIATNQLTRLTGAVMGGAIVALLGLGGIFACGILLYTAAIVLISGLARSAPSRANGRGLREVLRGLTESMREARRSDLVMGSLLISAVFNLWAFPYFALGPVVGEHVLGLGPSGIGVLMGMEPLGALVGSILIASRLHPRLFAPVYGLSPVVFVLGTTVLALTGSNLLAHMALFGAGLGMAAFAVMQMVLPMYAAPPEMRVRLVGLMAMTIGVAPLGFAHAGLMAEWLGAQNALLVIAAEGCIATLLVLLRYPELLTTRLRPEGVGTSGIGD